MKPLIFLSVILLTNFQILPKIKKRLCGETREKTNNCNDDHRYSG